jgi:DNA polymerase-3 subunit beta
MISAKEERLSFTMTARRLANIIADVSPSMPDADPRHFLNGALFSLDKAGLWVVSTDGHRLSISHESIVGADTLTPRNVIVPRKTVLLAKKLLGQSGNITLTLGAQDIQFNFEDGTVLLGKAVDGKYPNWRGAIPSTTERVTVSAVRLSNALAMIAAIPADKEKQEAMKNKVEIHFTKTTTTLRRGESGVCEMESQSSSDAPLDLAFNIDYLVDAVSIVGTSSADVVIGYSATATAITMQPKDKEYPLAVVMPLRV